MAASEKPTCRHLDLRLPASRTVGSDVPLPGTLPSPAQWLPRFPADTASSRATSKARDRMWAQHWSLALLQGPAVASEGSSHRGSSSSSKAHAPSLGPHIPPEPPAPRVCHLRPEAGPRGAGPTHTHPAGLGCPEKVLYHLEASGKADEEAIAWVGRWNRAMSCHSRQMALESAPCLGLEDGAGHRAVAEYGARGTML